MPSQARWVFAFENDLIPKHDGFVWLSIQQLHELFKPQHFSAWFLRTGREPHAKRRTDDLRVSCSSREDDVKITMNQVFKYLR